MKILYIILLLIISAPAFALPPGNDILIRDQDGEYMNINSDGTINVSGVGQIVRASDNGTFEKYSPTADTDAARGTALLSAVDDAVAGDSITIGPGTYSTGATKLNADVQISMSGSGPGITVLTSTFQGAGTGVAFYFATASRISNLTLNSGASTRTTGVSSVDSAATDVVFRNVYFTGGPEDALHLAASGVSTVDLIGCYMDSDTDGMTVTSSNVGRAFNTIFNLTGSGHAGFPSLGGVIEMHKCLILQGGSGAAVDSALGGVFRSFGTVIKNSSGGTEFNNSTSTFEIDNATDYNPAEVSGTLTAANQRVLVASAGVVDFNSGDVTLTHSADTITMAGGALVVNGALSSNNTITSSRTTDLGWTPVSGADTACNTTCTSACAFGFNLTAGVPGTMLLCTDATSDVCLCAGSS